MERHRTKRYTDIKVIKIKGLKRCKILSYNQIKYKRYWKLKRITRG